MQLAELLKSRGVTVKLTGEHHHARKGWAQLDCPFCGQGTGKFHMGLSLSGNYFHCYQCGKLDRVEVISLLLGIDKGEAFGILKDSDSTSPTDAPTRLNKGRLRLPPALGPLGPRHCLYLRGRGFDKPKALARLWGLKGIGLVIPMRLSWRIFIPIRVNGKTVSWTTRSILKNAASRYYTASPDEEIVSSKSVLYGEDLVNNAICVVEGPVDAWKIGPGAVATCGLGFTQAQLVRMAKYPVRGICFDNEPNAQLRAERLADSLSAFPGKTFVLQLDAKDAGDAGPHEIKQIRRHLGL